MDGLDQWFLILSQPG